MSGSEAFAGEGTQTPNLAKVLQTSRQNFVSLTVPPFSFHQAAMKVSNGGVNILAWMLGVGTPDWGSRSSKDRRGFLLVGDAFFCYVLFCTDTRCLPHPGLAGLENKNCRLFSFQFQVKG